MSIEGGTSVYEEEEGEEGGGWQIPTSKELLHFVLTLTLTLILTPNWTSKELLHFVVMELSFPSTNASAGEDSILGTEAMVDVEHSSLAMEGELKRAPPPGIRAFLSENAFDMRKVLKEKTDAVIDILLPFTSNYAQSTSKATTEAPDTASSSSLCLLLHGRAGVGKRSVARAAADAVGLHTIEMASDEISASTAAETGKALTALLERAGECAPCMVLLSQLEYLIKEEDRKPNGEVGLRWEAHLSKLPPGVVVLACCDNLEELTVSVRRAFIYEVEIEPLGEAERALYLGALLRWHGWSLDLDTITAGGRMPGYLLGDIRSVAASILTIASKRGDVDHPGSLLLTDRDVIDAVAIMAKRGANAAAKANIPNVSWKDIGGFQTHPRAQPLSPNSTLNVSRNSTVAVTVTLTLTLTRTLTLTGNLRPGEGKTRDLGHSATSSRASRAIRGWSGTTFRDYFIWTTRYG